MLLSNWLVVIVTALYLGVAVTAAFEGNMGKAVMFGGYAIANLGVLMS